jgi:transcription elongation factor Elf1
MFFKKEYEVRFPCILCEKQKQLCDLISVNVKVPIYSGRGTLLKYINQGALICKECYKEKEEEFNELRTN